MTTAEERCQLEPPFTIVPTRDARRTAEWYCEHLNFAVRRNCLGDYVLEGFGEIVVLHGSDDAKHNPLFDVMPQFQAEDVAALRRQFIARGLKLVRDAEIPGLGIGCIELEDCDGRTIRFVERKDGDSA